MSKNSKRSATKVRSNHSNRRSRRRQRRSRGVHPLVWMGGIVGIVIVLFAVGFWRSGAFAKQPPPSRSKDPTQLLPLAQAGSTIRGEHDMAMIPEQTPAPRAAPSNVPVARLELPSESHNFGRIYSSWDVTHVFAVQNTGTADLQVGNLVTSCGCTVAELSSNVIPPGERADLMVTFDADFHATRGEVTRLVWFATNDPTRPWVEVRITADVG